MLMDSNKTTSYTMKKVGIIDATKTLIIIQNILYTFYNRLDQLPSLLMHNKMYLSILIIYLRTFLIWNLF